MKTISLLSSFLFILISTVAFGQQKGAQKETIKVWGNCGMCKKTIETAAKNAGASQATWNDETRELDVTYKAKKTNSDKIQQAIAAAGYDTEKFTADNAVYDNLHECCKYDRKESSASTQPDCCKKGGCKEGACQHGTDCKKGNGNCKDKSCCKS